MFERNEERGKRKIKNKLIVESMVNLWEIGNDPAPTDILGSYKGIPYDADDLQPEQDADDL